MMEIIKYKIELVKESSATYNITNSSMSSPDMVYEVIKEKFKIACLTEEMFGILCLDNKNHITGFFEVSHGNLTSCMVHPREVFKRAMLVNSASVILFHNHPSGNAEPSDNDIKITEKLFDAGKILGINVIDHIIICDDCFMSFKDHGYL